MSEAVWTPETIDLLRQLWDGEGKSATECAVAINQRFGRAAVSRNAVIGKVHRLRLTRRPNPISTTLDGAKRIRVQGGSRPAPSLPQMPSPVRRSRRRAPPKPPAPPPVLLEPPRNGTLPTIVDVTGCKWSVDEDANGRHLFCNHPRSDTHASYCPFHAAQSVQATVERKPQRPHQPRLPSFMIREIR